MKKKKILAITGIRSEYDILFPVLNEIRKDKRFELKIIVCGAHLSEWHNTLGIIRNDGFAVADYIDNLFITDRTVQRAKGAGLLTYAMAQTVEREKPDFLIYVGDREEGIAGAIIANYMNVLFVHLSGGDSACMNADDPMRFAISRLAHVHCVFAGPYGRNLLKVGEEAFRIHNTGNPSLDNIRMTPAMSLAMLSRKLGVNLTDTKYIVFLMHSLSSELDQAGQQLDTALESASTFCRREGMQLIGIYPNTDPGAYEIERSIGKHIDGDHISFFRNLPRLQFVNLMRHASALAGNSSMGFLEAPYYGLPVVNIGNRQRGRLNAGNVEYVPFVGKRIIGALQKACFDSRYRARLHNMGNPFGDGLSAKRIVNVLAAVDPDDMKWHMKKKLC